MSALELLHNVAVLGGVSGQELLACDVARLRPKELWLLAQWLVLPQASHISGAIDAIGIEGNETLTSWVTEAALGGWGVANTPARGSLPGKLPNCCHNELRKAVQMSLSPHLDGPCSIRLARLGYVRFARWSSLDMEEKLHKDLTSELSEESLEHIMTWFVAGLAQQTEVLLQGLGQLVYLPVALGVSEEPLELQAVIIDLLQMVTVVHGCLRAAAPMVKYDLPVCNQVDRLPCLLALRVLDWAYRRVEVERTGVVLRIDWRLHTAELIWKFLTGAGTKAGGPKAVVDAFTICIVLPACRNEQSKTQAKLPEDGTEKSQRRGTEKPNEDSQPRAAQVEAASAARAESVCSEEPAEDPAAEAKLPASKETRRKRAQRKRNKEATTTRTSSSPAADDAAVDSSPEESAEPPAELSRAMREWNRLSVQMMLDMGWRAEDGGVD
mmetsp:Transcript_5427/g.8079  ORF Transcript_5427/g.8079 Transcript_5427/m.8079 type:complete len:440 (+) Transcript_5427:81-1400(+)